MWYLSNRGVFDASNNSGSSSSSGGGGNINSVAVSCASFFFFVGGSGDGGGGVWRYTRSPPHKHMLYTSLSVCVRLLIFISANVLDMRRNLYV